MKKKGFTLVELLAVIGIIVVIMGLVIGAAGSAMHKSKIAAVKSMISKLEMAVENYKSAFDEYPPDLSYRYLGVVHFSYNHGSVKPLLTYEKKWTKDGIGTNDVNDLVYVDSWGSEYNMFWVGLPGSSILQQNYITNYKNLVSDTGFLAQNSMRYMVVQDDAAGFVSTNINDHVLTHGILIWSSGPNFQTTDSDDDSDNIGNWGYTRSKMM